MIENYGRTMFAPYKTNAFTGFVGDGVLDVPLV